MSDPDTDGRPLAITRGERFVVVDFGTPHALLSWAPHRGGATVGTRVAWHRVVPGDLPLDVDPIALLRERLEREGLLDTTTMMTGRTLDALHEAHADADGVRCHVVVTAGLGNAVRVGDPVLVHEPVGTINILCVLDRQLSESARLEVMSLVVEARTLAMLEVGLPSVQSDGVATGTGTDCVVVASPVDGDADPLVYAGKHTAAGAAVGQAVLEATRAAIARWCATRPE